MRKSIVAGQFYSSNKEELKKNIEGYLKDINKSEKNVKGIIVPHAGYYFSGKCAAYAYKQLNNYELFIIIGTNHNGDKTCISMEDFETPLGIVKNNKEYGKKLNIPVDEEMHSKEHSIEVQLPFLQVLFKNFRIVPILIGDDYEKHIKKLKKVIEDNKICVICSGDFTHYGENYGYVPFEEYIKHNLYELDKGAIDLILKRKFKEFNEYVEKSEATICGRNSISLLIKLMNKDGKLLKYYTSGDIVKDYKNAVGYAAICF